MPAENYMEYKDGEEVNEVLSTIGNAFFSGVSFDQLWDCITLTDDRAKLDAAIKATIDLNELVDSSRTS